MSTVKSIIYKNVPTDLTAVYTNSSGGSALLKAVNINGIADNTVMTTTTGEGAEWSFFGTNNAEFATTSVATDCHGGTPLAIKVSTDRILLVWTPHHTHAGSGVDWLGNSVIHCQIMEWQTNKYVAGPITNVTLPTAPFTSITNGLFTQPGSGTAGTHYAAKLVTLSPSKVMFVYRIGTAFRAVRLDINVNAVSPTSSANYDLTQAASFNSTSALPFDIAKVPGTTNKMMVVGSNGSTWVSQVLTVPDSGGGSITGSTAYNIGLTATAYYCTITPLNRAAVGGVITYSFAGTTTTNTVISIQNITLNTSTDAMAVVGSAVTKTAITAFNGLESKTLSTDTTANAVIGYIDTGNYGNFYTLFQNSLTQSQNNTTTTALQHSSARGLATAYEWGDTKAVFAGFGNTLVSVNSSTNAENLMPATYTTTATLAGAVQFWFPFDTRPLYTIYETSNLTGTKIAQYYARVGAGSGTTGVLTETGNYLPYGHNYGGHYAWSDQAQCWFVGFGGRIYALDTTGRVINELNTIYLSPNFALTYAIRLLTVTKSGKILFAAHQTGAHTSYYFGQYWDSMVGTTQLAALNTLNSYTELTSKPTLLGTVTQSSTCHAPADITHFTDANNIDRAYITGAYSDATNISLYYQTFDGSKWQSGGAYGLSATAKNASFHYGNRPNWRLIQDSPADSTNQLGLFRLVGGTALSSAANMTRYYISATPYNEGQFSSLTAGTALSTTTPSYAIGKRATTNLSVVYTYNLQYSAVTMHTVYNGRLVQGVLGTNIISTNNAQFVNAVATKFSYAIAPCNTSNAYISQQAFVFDSNVYITTPRVTLTASSDNGYTTLNAVSQVKFNVYAQNINSSYTIVGPDLTNKVYITVNDGTNDFYITPITGQTIRTDASFRTNDTYMIPDGYSVKMKSTLPISLDALLSVVEEA